MPMKSVVFTVPGTYTWVPPSGVSAAIATFCGAGAGGNGSNVISTGGGCLGGGSGELVEGKLVPVPPGGLSIVVGAKGAGASGFVSSQGFDGGFTSVGPFRALGGLQANGGTGGGNGGGPRYGKGAVPAVDSAWGTAESPHVNGGGGGGGNSLAVQIQGHDAPGKIGRALNGTGSFTVGVSGASSPWGLGGAGGDKAPSPGGNGFPAAGPGAGGGGSGSVNTGDYGPQNYSGGNGGDGIVELVYFSP